MVCDEYFLQFFIFPAFIFMKLCFRFTMDRTTQWVKSSDKRLFNEMWLRILQMRFRLMESKEDLVCFIRFIHSVFLSFFLAFVFFFLILISIQIFTIKILILFSFLRTFFPLIPHWIHKFFSWLVFNKHLRGKEKKKEIVNKRTNKKKKREFENSCKTRVYVSSVLLNTNYFYIPRMCSCVVCRCTLMFRFDYYK